MDEPRQPPGKKRARPVYTTISLKDIKNEIDPTKLFECDLPKTMSSPRSEPVTSTAENHKCPHCGHELGGFPFSQGSTRYPDYEPDSPSVVPTHGPLATAAKEGGLSAMEELKLLKTQFGTSLVSIRQSPAAISLGRLPFRSRATS